MIFAAKDPTNNRLKFNTSFATVTAATTAVDWAEDVTEELSAPATRPTVVKPDLNFSQLFA